MLNTSTNFSKKKFKRFWVETHLTTLEITDDGEIWRSTGNDDGVSVREAESESW